MDDQTRSFASLGITKPEFPDLNQLPAYDSLTERLLAVTMDETLDLTFTASELSLNGSDEVLNFAPLIECIFQCTENLAETLVFLSKTLLTLKRLYANLSERNEELSAKKALYEADRLLLFMSLKDTNPLLMGLDASARKKKPTQKEAQCFLQTEDEFSIFEEEEAQFKAAKRKVWMLVELCQSSIDTTKLLASIEYENETLHEVYHVDYEQVLRKWRDSLRFTV